MKYRDKEKGVALLIALGFASLLLVLVMGFVTNVLLEKKTAQNKQEEEFTNDIAQNAIEQAIAAMRFYMLYLNTKSYDEGIYRFDNIVSKNDKDENITDEELAKIFKKHSSGRYFFEYMKDLFIYEYPKNDTTNYNYNKNEDDEDIKALDNNRRKHENKLRRPQWQYIKDAENKKIIGRFMYAALPDYGKVHMYSLDDFDHKGNVRYGKTMKEFDRQMFSSYLQVADSDFERVGKWLSEQVYKDSDIIKEDNFKNRAFTVFNSIETEDRIDGTNDKNELNYKFRYGHGYKDRKSMQKLSSIPRDVTELQNAVPFLKRIDSDDSKRKQIAANLIEAFNPDLEKDVEHDGEFDGDTKYTGNRRTPYINEIAVTLSNLKANVVTLPDGKINVKPSVDVKVQVELYDPYEVGYNLTKDSFGLSQDIQITFNAEVHSKGESNKLVSLNIGENGLKFPEANFKNEENTKYPYVTFEKKDVMLAENLLAEGIDLNDAGTISIKITPKITAMGYWKYIHGDKVVDFVKLNGGNEDSYSGNTVTVNEGNVNSNLPNTEAKTIAKSVKDARVNLNDSDWEIKESSLGSSNGVEIEKYFPKSEDKYKYKYSLSDLGLISRGESGKTLNIHNVSSIKLDEKTANSVDLDIDGKCDKSCSPCSHFANENIGDGGLLDQLTVMSDEKPQLIDINTRSVAVWCGLLSGIKDDEGKYIFSNDGNEQDKKLIRKIAAKISKELRDKGYSFRSRSGFIKVFNDIWDDSFAPRIQESDPDKKEKLISRQKQIIIGTIMSLCKTEEFPEYINMIVIAQKIKDIGGGNPFKYGEFFGTYETGKDIVTSQVKYFVKLRYIIDYENSYKTKFEVIYREKID